MGYRQGKNPFSKSPLNFSSPLNSFDSLVGKLMNQGKSKEAATKIAGKVANAKMEGAGSGPTAAQKARSKGSAAKMADESPLDKELVGNQKNLPDHLKNAIEAAPESPAKMKSPIKAHGKKLKALEKRIEKVRKSKEGSEGQGGIDYELLSELEAQKKQMIESHDKQAKETKDSPAKMKDGKTGKSHSEMSDKEKGKHMAKHQGKGKREKLTRPEASKRAADQLNAKDPIKGSPAKQKGGRGDHSKMTDGEYSRHLASPRGKKEHTFKSGSIKKNPSEGNKKKSPLNNAYENPQYIQPTKSSYGQDMDNFFGTVNQAYDQTQTDENRLERASRIKSKFEEKDAAGNIKMKSGLSDRQKKRYGKFSGEKTRLEDKIGRAGFNIDNLSSEQISSLKNKLLGIK